MKNVKICNYCLQALKSHGEQFTIIGDGDGMENIVNCEFCGEQTESYDVKIIQFKY